METTFTSVDLHVHSKFSRHPSLWILQKLGCPESYTEPVRLYEIARKKGMSLVTLTDHNCIEGCLEIAHLPNVFMSEEVTATFPGDGCKIHVLVYDITEEHHREIQRLKEDVFELTAYLQQEEIFHSLAHPLYPVNDMLTKERFEQLLLLFQNFELNGARDANQNVCLKRILESLTPSQLEQLTEKHGIVPAFPEPWIKRYTGGSDDHSSLKIAGTHTRIPGNLAAGEFFRELGRSRSEVCSEPSSPQALAHNIYGIGYQHYAQKLGLERHSDKDMFLKFLSRTLQPNCEENGEISVFSRFYGAWRNRRHQIWNGGSNVDLKELVQRESHHILRNHPELMEAVTDTSRQPNEMDGRWSEFVKLVSNRVLHRFADHLLGHVQGADVFSIFQSIGTAGGLYTLLAPYFISYSVFSRAREFNREALSWFSCESGHGENKDRVRVAHFTDTLYEINGVALTLRQQAQIAGKTNKDLRVITCGSGKLSQVETIQEFSPVGVYELPEYPELKLFYPPFLEMLGYCYEESFTHLHSATPGPIGLAALGIARILKLPIYGTYHTALPQYARLLTNDTTVEDLVQRYTVWYYDQMDSIFVPSVSTARELVEKGISKDKIRYFPRGIDIQRFNPSVQNGYLQKHLAPASGFKLLYVGRVSREKGLPLLERVFKSLVHSSSPARPVQLVVVGDGPYLEQMRRNLSDFPCIFTGYLEGDDLVSVYNSCDLFVFPSDTDTFGNVVLEAQACGLPTVVSDCGGPMENVLNGETGLVVSSGMEAEFKKAIESLLSDPLRLKKMSRAARRYMEERSFENCFNDVWSMYGDRSRGSLNTLAQAV